MMMKLTSSLADRYIIWVSVLTVAIQMLMATNARSVVVTLAHGAEESSPISVCARHQAY